MGTGEKKHRREANRVLNRFSIRYGDDVYPFREHLAAKDMLAEYAKPMDGLFDTLTTRYAVAVFAWNLSLVPEERREALVQEFIDPLIGDSEEGKKTLSNLIEAMVERRESLYPDENGLILPTEEEEQEQEEGVEEALGMEIADGEQGNDDEEGEELEEG